MAEATQLLDSVVRVEVSDEPLIPGRMGTNERGAYTVPSKQVCYLWQGGERYPTRFEFAVPEDGQPRRPGFYFLAGKAFGPADFGRLKWLGDRTLALVSVDDVLAQLAKAPGLKAA